MRRFTPRLSLAALVLAFFFTATAEETKPVLDRDNAASEARILDDLKYITSDECEGRGIQTQGINKAADRIAGEFKKAGLKPGGVDGTYFQPFEVFATNQMGEGNKMTLKGPNGESVELQLGKDFSVVAFGGSGTVSAPVVFAGYGVGTEK